MPLFFAFATKLRIWPVALALLIALICAPLAMRTANAQDHQDHPPSDSSIETAVDKTVDPTNEEGHKTAEEPSVFEPEHGTWFNLLARNLFATPAEKAHMAENKERVETALERAEQNQPLSAAETSAFEKSERIAAAKDKDAEHLSAQESKDAEFAATYQAAVARKSGQTLTDEQAELLKVHYVAKYDWLLYTPLLWLLLFLMLSGAARKAKIRPQGKGHSLTNSIEWAVESFQDYLIGVMGNDLARRFTPMLASFFFTILAMNWLGLIPGMLSPTTQPAIPIAMAIVGFVAVHVLAIKEAGFKTWILHFVGEPIWLAPLNFPLHIIGELIKPISLSLRLLCNVFGEEAVVATLALLAVTALPPWLPIPFQFPMLVLGTFFGFLQALVFATLLAIYLSIFMTHEDHAGEDGHAGEHTEHAFDHNGGEHIVGRPTALTVGS